MLFLYQIPVGVSCEMTLVTIGVSCGMTLMTVTLGLLAAEEPYAWPWDYSILCKVIATYVHTIVATMQ